MRIDGHMSSSILFSYVAVLCHVIPRIWEVDLSTRETDMELCPEGGKERQALLPDVRSAEVMSYHNVRSDATPAQQ